MGRVRIELVLKAMFYGLDGDGFGEPFDMASLPSLPETRMRILLAFMCLVASPALGQDLATDLKTCAAIESDLQRLVCYDALAGGATPAVTPDSAAPGRWQVSEEINPMDDTKTVVMVLPESGAGGGFGRDVTLILRCRSAQFEAFIAWNDYLASDGGHNSGVKDVTLRWDSEEPRTDVLSTSTDSTATFFSAPVSFFKLLQSHQKLVAQVTPYNEGPRTAVFEVSGLKDGATALRKACKL